MALKTFVKISNVNNLSDARYCAGMYVDLMGFSLESNDKNFVSPDNFREITEWLSGLSYVGEFKTSHPDSILTILKDYEGIDYIQIEEKAHLQMLLNSGYNLILKVDIHNENDLQELVPLAKSLGENNIPLLLESDVSPVPDGIWAEIKELTSQCEVLLGFGFDAGNVEGVLEKTKAKGIAMKGGNEIKPGFKDFDELADILETLEKDE